MQRLIDKFSDAVTVGNRPFRILLFGGIFLGLLLMNILAKIFNVNTKLGGDINLANVILITVSLLIGFLVSYSIVHFADANKRRRRGDLDKRI